MYIYIWFYIRINEMKLHNYMPALLFYFSVLEKFSTKLMFSAEQTILRGELSGVTVRE